MSSPAAVCCTEIEAFEHVGRALRSNVEELPAGLNWNRLAAEMTANIHLGLEAGECVGPAPVRKGRSNGLASCAGDVRPDVPFVCGLVVESAASHTSIGDSYISGRDSDGSGGNRSERERVCLDSFCIRGDSRRPIIVSTPGSLRARFVDADTGQVTINNVYSD